MLLLVDHTGMQLDFFHLLRDLESVAFAFDHLTGLPLGCRLCGSLLGWRAFELARAELPSGGGRLLSLLLITSRRLRPLLCRLSVGRWRGLRWRALRLRRAQRFARFSRRLLGLRLTLGLDLIAWWCLGWRRGGGLRKNESCKAEYRNAHKENVFSPLEHSIRLWHRRGVAVGLWEAPA